MTIIVPFLVSHLRLSVSIQLLASEIQMALSPPLKHLNIETDQTGFYKGFNTFVTLGSKILIGVLILWAAV